MGKKRGRHRTKKGETILEDLDPVMDDTFAFIAGFTSGGAPYGLTWEDVGIDSDLPFDEKVRLYMGQTEEPLEGSSPDGIEELPF